MLPDRVSNPGPLTYESGALPIALRSLAAVSLYQHENQISLKYRQQETFFFQLNVRKKMRIITICQILNLIYDVPT